MAKTENGNGNTVNEKNYVCKLRLTMALILWKHTALLYTAIKNLIYAFRCN